MNEKITKIIQLCLILILPVFSNAQNDVTQFLDVPVDGYKPEMINKLKSKGFTINKQSEDVLDGEFNGINVNLFISTNNNKVWRITVYEVNPTDETNIKIRFNNLIQQFAKNNRYSEQADSTLVKYTIPKDEDISYEINVRNKRYEAVFYQKSLKYDSLIKEAASLYAKGKLNDEDNEKLKNIFSESLEESLKSLNKLVWFMIKEEYGKYRILIFYENEYNKANGKGL
jgi:hypothetical protein